MRDYNRTIRVKKLGCGRVPNFLSDRKHSESANSRDKD